MNETSKLLTLPEQIALQLRQQIYSEIYKKGQYLRETELSRRFGVSRGPVRQALARLAGEELLEFRPNVGVRVSDHPSEAAFSLMVQLRNSIEAFVLERVFSELDETSLREIEQRLAGIRECCESRNQQRLMLADYAFHEYFIEKYSDRHVLGIWGTVTSRMMMRYSRFDDLMTSYEEHRAVVEAIRQGNKREALQALQQNIQ